MKVLIVCASGMSSSLLVQKLRDQIAQKGLSDYKIAACASNQLHELVPQSDIVLIAPQLTYIKESILELFGDEKNKRLLEIRFQDYGSLNTDNILEQILHADQKAEQDSVNPFTNRLLTWLVRMAEMIGTNRTIQAITNGMIAVIPISIVGSLFTLFTNIPYAPLADWLTQHGITTILELPVAATIDCLALYFCYFISYRYTNNKSAFGAPLVSLICFLIVIGRVEGSMIDVTYLGAKGLFTSIIVSIFVSKVYERAEKLFDPEKIMPGIPMDTKAPFLVILPAMVCIFLTSCLAVGMAQTSYGTFPNMISVVMQDAMLQFMGKSLASFLITNILANLFWFFGLHGGNLVSSLMAPIYEPLALENLAAFKAGLPLPHIINSQFKKTFTHGGVGSTLSLAFLMCFRAKSQKLRQIGRIALPTSIFFINEPIIFGLPLVMNPLFVLPLLFVTPICGALTYFVMSIGLIPAVSGMIEPWTMPPIIFGLLQGSWKIALWEVVMLFLAGALWYPFFRIADRIAYKEEQGKPFQADAAS